MATKVRDLDRFLATTPKVELRDRLNRMNKRRLFDWLAFASVFLAGGLLGFLEGIVGLVLTALPLAVLMVVVILQRRAEEGA